MALGQGRESSGSSVLGPPPRDNYFQLALIMNLCCEGKLAKTKGLGTVYVLCLSLKRRYQRPTFISTAFKTIFPPIGDHEPIPACKQLTATAV